ncbi:MAG: hypothetical protein QME96_11625, partial [Myxococcota bacterium]|nr:hypothetical protein [Myxococcota bacterium]
TAPAYGLFQVYADEYPGFRAQMGYSREDYWAFVDRHVAALGIHFTRSNLVFIWGFLEPEVGASFVWADASLPEEAVVMPDIVLPAVFAPAPGKQMDFLAVLEPARERGVPVERQELYPRGREAEWERYVRAAVERYDSDGVEDGPPGVRVRHWQVMNEPFISLETGFLTVEEYAELARMTARAVRAADPQARVVLGDTGRFTLEVIAALGGEGIFDAIDVHFYPLDLSPASAGLPLLRRALDEHGYGAAEIWMTELGTWVHQPPPPPDSLELAPHTEADQARFLIQAMLGNRALGVARILWAPGLVAWSNLGFFNYMGLVSSGVDSGDEAADVGRERIAYHAYRRLVAETETDVADLIGLRAGSTPALAVVELRSRVDGQAFFVAWTDGASASIELPWGAPGARVTNLVPDASGRFTESTVTATGGLLSVAVDPDPRLIKPQE